MAQTKLRKLVVAQISLSNSVLRSFVVKTSPEEIEEQDQEYLSLKESLIHQHLPADTSAVLRSHREVV